jgi:hypothetical protein
MKRLKIHAAYSKIEIRRALRLRNKAAALLFFILAMVLIQDGISQYRDHMKQKEDFKKIEVERVKKYPNYTGYGAIGMRLYFAPAPLEIFFNKSAAAPQMTAVLNNGERLSIDTSMNGGDMFKNRGGNFADFDGLMMLAGYFAVIFYGVATFRHKRYHQLLAKITGNRQMFWHTVISRYQVIGLFFLALTAAAVGLVLINGIVLSSRDYIHLAGYILDWQLTAFFLFILGSLVGKLPSRETGNLLAVIVWFVVVLVLPAAAEKAVEKKSAGIISNFQAELEKWNQIIAFEHRAIQEAGKFKPEKANTESVKRLVESFINNEYRHILAAERQLEIEIAENAKFYRNLSTVFPTTSHCVVANGLSGKGYEAGVGFYRRSRIIKEGFADFYKKKRYYSNDKQVEPFVKGEENVYYGDSQPPGNFWVIESIKLGWVLVVLVAAYLVNRSDLYGYRLNAKAENTPQALALERGKRQVLRVYGDGTGDYLYRVLSGKGRKNGKGARQGKEKAGNGKGARQGKGNAVLWESRDLAASPCPVEFVYLCAPGDLPGDIPVRDFLAIPAAINGKTREEYTGLLERLKLGRKAVRYSQLSLMKQFEVLMSLVEGARGDIYIFRNTALDMPAGAYIVLKERMAQLAELGAAVIYLTPDPLAVDRELETQRDYRQMDLKAWDHMVESLKRYNETREKRGIREEGEEKSVEDSDEIELVDETPA